MYWVIRERISIKISQTLIIPQRRMLRLGLTRLITGRENAIRVPAPPSNVLLNIRAQGTETSGQPCTARISGQQSGLGRWLPQKTLYPRALLLSSWALLGQLLKKLPKRGRKSASRAIWICLSSFKDQIQLILLIWVRNIFFIMQVFLGPSWSNCDLYYYSLKFHGPHL